MSNESVHLVQTEFHGWWTLTAPHLTDVAITSWTRDRPIGFRPAEYLFEAGVYFETTYCHEAHHVVDGAGDTFIVRWQIDDFHSKYAATHALSRAMADERVTPNMKLLQPMMADGSRLLIIVEPHDTVGWVIDQLGETECATLCVYWGREEVVFIPWGRAGATFPDVRDISQHLGVGREDTIGALEAVLLAHRQEGRIRRLAVPETRTANNPWRSITVFVKGGEAEMRALLREP